MVLDETPQNRESGNWPLGLMEDAPAGGRSQDWGWFGREQLEEEEAAGPARSFNTNWPQGELRWDQAKRPRAAPTGILESPIVTSPPSHRPDLGPGGPFGVGETSGWCREKMEVSEEPGTGHGALPSTTGSNGAGGKAFLQEQDGRCIPVSTAGIPPAKRFSQFPSLGIHPGTHSDAGAAAHGAGTPELPGFRACFPSQTLPFPPTPAPSPEQEDQVTLPEGNPFSMGKECRPPPPQERARWGAVLPWPPMEAHG